MLCWIRITGLVGAFKPYLKCYTRNIILVARCMSPDGVCWRETPAATFPVALYFSCLAVTQGLKLPFYLDDMRSCRRRRTHHQRPRVLLAKCNARASRSPFDEANAKRSRLSVRRGHPGNLTPPRVDFPRFLHWRRSSCHISKPPLKKNKHPKYLIKGSKVH